MKRYDIDKIFTRLMGEYLEDGYLLNTNTMSGHQGEVAKVDLRKGDEVIRLVLEKGTNWNSNADWYAITIGRCVEPVRKEDWATIWTSKLEEIDRYCIYQIGKDWYTGIEGYAKRCSEKRHARWKNGWYHVDPLTNSHRDLPDSCRKVILNRVRSMNGFKSVKLCDITKVRRVVNPNGTIEFVADVRHRTVVVGTVKCA